MNLFRHSERAVGEGIETDSARLAASPFPRGTETVLVVENDEAARQYITVVLRELGYVVLEAPGIPEALRLVQKRRVQAVDLVVMDLAMPVIGGRELFDRLHSLFPNHRALFCSELPDRMAKRKWRIDQEIPFLQKPITAKRLATKVRQVLDRPDQTGSESPDLLHAWAV